MFASFVQKRHPHLTYEQCLEVSRCIECQYDTLPTCSNGGYDMEIIGRSADEWTASLLKSAAAPSDFNVLSALLQVENMLGKSIKRGETEFKLLYAKRRTFGAVLEFVRGDTGETVRVTLEAFTKENAP